MTRFVPTARGMVLLTLMAALVVVAMPAAAQAEVVDPANCTETVEYDPSIPTFAQVASKNGFANPSLGGFRTGEGDRHVTAQLYAYEEAIANATVNNPRVRVIVRNIGPTTGGRTFQYSIVGTPENIAGVEDDAAFYRAVRSGAISRDAAIADIKTSPRPAFAWVTETPHGDEPAGGEASMRMLYELAARTDCANVRRLQQLDVFLNPARNPDGRDRNTRGTAWGFDPNRDLMYQTQDVNSEALDTVFQYPSLIFIDAHQQSQGYFFPPNEDPVHREISHFALDSISKVIGPALQERFNDQSLQYRNYNRYDLFVPEFGDSATALILGAAGMTYEKGNRESYGKQVYDHYLAIDETLNVISKEKDELLEGWIAQWQEAAQQGANCELQRNTLVSPLHETIDQQPGISICGYYFKPGLHSGDTAHILELLRNRDVHVYRLDQPLNVGGAYDWGSGEATAQTLPAGTLWVPTSQTMKHWINATLEENPFIPYPFFFDVVDWSFSSLSSAAGNGQLQAPLPAGAQMTEVTGALGLGGVTAGEKPVLAFATDSMEGLALAVDLLGQGAVVSRAGEAFDAAGVHLPTGAALVDAASLAGIDLAALAAEHETPVFGLDAYPVARFPLAKPKIAVHAGNNIPSNPFTGTGTGHCNSGNGFCEMTFTLSEAMGIPRALLTPVTTAQISSGILRSQNFTALASNNQLLSATAGTPIAPALALQQFVNAGGNFVTNGQSGASTMRNAGMSRLNVSSTATWDEHCPDNNDPDADGELTTPGTTFSAEFNTESPAAWGFDEGGYIYRTESETSTNPVFDPASLTGNGAAIKDATAAASYADSLVAYGYQCNGLEPGHLPGRPYVVDQPFGAGHSTEIGSEAFFRAWSASTQRLVFNGILYPNTQAIAAGPAGPAPAAKRVLAAKPLSPKQLPAVKDRALKIEPNPQADVVVTVKRSQLNLLKEIVRKAKLPAPVASRVRWEAGSSAGKVTMRIVGASQFSRRWKGDPSTKGEALWALKDLELRPLWAWRIINGMVRHRLPHQDRI